LKFCSSFAAVEPAYDGPRIPDEGVSSDFMKDLLQRFKEQKKLHKRCRALRFENSSKWRSSCDISMRFRSNVLSALSCFCAAPAGLLLPAEN